MGFGGFPKRRWSPHLSPAYHAKSHFLAHLRASGRFWGRFYSLLYSCNGFFSTRTCDILTHLSIVQHPQPENVYPEFPPQMQSSHPHSSDFQQQGAITDHPVDSRPFQPLDQSTIASVAQNPYGIPTTMYQRFLAKPGSTLSQHCPPYVGSVPGPLTGIALPYFPTGGFPQGTNYIGYLNIESPTRPKQSRKRKRKGEYNISHEEVC